MTSKPKDKSRSREAHIYMTEAMHAKLAKRAQIECRSVNGQILHYVMRCLDDDATRDSRPT